MTADETAYDVVVVGAGLGGLTAGARLAQAGEDVLVLERHTIPGGCATTYSRLDFDFEVSLHEIEGLDEYGGIQREMFDQLDVLDELDFEPLPDLFHYNRGDEEMVVPHGREAAMEVLIERFPHEEEEIRRFFDVIFTIRDSMDTLPLARDLTLREMTALPVRHRALFKYRDTTLGEFLDDVIDDEELKLVLAVSLAYVHDDPYSMSFPIFAVGWATLFDGPGYYVRGGSQALSDHLASVIEDNGGTIEFERLVTDIHVEDGVASGVRHRHARLGGDEARTEEARAVVVNAAVPTVADEMLPEPYGDRLAEQFEGWELAPSVTNLYLGFGTPPSELGVEHYSTVFQHPTVERLPDMGTCCHGSFGQRTLNFVDYSQIDADLAPPGKSVGVLTTLDYYSEWAGLTDAEYREKKQRVEEVLLRRLGEEFPQLPDAVEHAELSTPMSIEGYTRNPAGTPFGFAQTPSQSGLNRRIEPPVENVKFASVWTFPGGGYNGAMIAGYRAALSLLEG